MKNENKEKQFCSRDAQLIAAAILMQKMPSVDAVACVDLLIEILFGEDDKDA
jgi:hypothetical protein